MTTLEDTFNPYDYLKNDTENDEFYYDYELPFYKINICDGDRISKTKIKYIEPIPPKKYGTHIDIPKTIEENLKIKHYIKIGEECSICYDDINHKDNAYLTDCGHSFHKICINKWLIETKFDGNCPICRQDIGIYDADTYSSSGNSLDKLECLWLDYDKLYPKYCSYRSKFIHPKGFDKYCDNCLKYRKFG